MMVQVFSYDVVVAGSGASGLMAALSASACGARVQVLERSPMLGGTSAISGGQIWSPMNALMVRGGSADESAAALTYLSRVTLGKVSKARLTHYLAQSPRLLECLEAWTDLRFFRVDRPDYHPSFDGARDGRAFEPLPYDTSRLGEWRSSIRTSPVRGPVTSLEARSGLDPKIVAARREADTRTQGAALVAGLVQACLDHGVTFELNARVIDLQAEPEAGWRCTFEHSEGVRASASSRAVILASGGFEWSTPLKNAFLAPADQAPTSPPWNEGDGLVIGLRLGAGMAHMTEAWWTAAIQVPGEQSDGSPMFRNIVRELALPGSMMVNGLGHRFANEASSYHELGKAFQNFDATQYRYPNIPAWMIFDGRFKHNYQIINVPAAAPAPDWFKQADTVENLADEIGVEPGALAASVARFNAAAVSGLDEDFGRGGDRHGRTYGDRGHAPNPCLGELRDPPFYAIPILHGNNGTKGGLTTDVDGRVTRFDDSVFANLYACGNVAASIMGPGYPGTGGSLGPIMTAAIAAGQSAAQSIDVAAH